MKTTIRYIRTNIFTLALVLSLLLSACAAGTVANGQVYPVGLVESLQGIQAAAKGCPFCFIYTSEKLILLGWPQGIQYGFAAFSKDGKPILELMEQLGFTANKTSPQNMAELIKGLVACGWKQGTPKDIPALTLQTILAYSITVLGEMAGTMPTILVLPAAQWQPPQMQETTPL